MWQGDLSSDQDRDIHAGFASGWILSLSKKYRDNAPERSVKLEGS
jgi:hypothetical protein